MNACRFRSRFRSLSVSRYEYLYAGLAFLVLVCTTSASDRTEANNGASCAFYIPGILGTRQILSRYYDGSRHFSLLKRRENRFQWPFHGRMETSFPNYSSLDENTPPVPEEEKGVIR